MQSARCALLLCSVCVTASCKCLNLSAVQATTKAVNTHTVVGMLGRLTAEAARLLTRQARPSVYDGDQEVRS